MLVQRAPALSAPTLGLIRLGVFAFLAWLYAVRLGAGSLWDNSETTYGEIVKEMFRTGDWLTLHLNFRPWYIHPPLWFWITGLSVRLFGLDEFALRVPAALFGLLTTVATYRAARRMYGEAAGLLAALALGTSLEVIVISRLAIMDSMLLFFSTIATLWIFFAIRDGDRRSFWIAVVASALGTLTKGPVALVLPAGTLVTYLLATLAARRGLEGSWARLPWLAGALAYVALAGSWFFVQAAINGPRFLHAFFGQSTFGRYLSPFENQPGPLWYYIPIAVIGFFPFVAFLPKALATAWSRRTGDDIFLLAAAVMPFVFFSAAQTKLPNYIVAIFPSCAIMVGATLADAIAANSVKTLRGALVVLPVALLLVTAGVILYGERQPAGAFSALAPSLALLGWFVVPTAIATGIVTYAARRAWVAPAGLGLMMAGFIAAVTYSILPRAEAFKPMKQMAHVVMSHYRTGDKVGIGGQTSGGFSLLFYTESRGTTSVGLTPGLDEAPETFFGQPARVLAVISPSDVEAWARRGIHIRFWVLERTPMLMLVTNRAPAAAGRGS